MQNRTVLFIVLSLVILVAYPYVMKLAGIQVLPPTPPPAAEAPVPATTPGAVPLVPTAPVAPTPAPVVASTAGVAPAAVAQVPAAQLQPARTVVVETDRFTATFSTQGGVVTSWKLKDYTEEDRTTQVELFSPPNKGDVRFPLSVQVGGNPGFESGIYTVDRDSLSLSGSQTGALRFVHVDPASGATVTKTVVFGGDRYDMDLRVAATGLSGDLQVSLGSNFGIHDWGAQRTIGFKGVANLIEDEVTREDPDDMQQPLSRSGDLKWTVSEGKYFLSSLMPKAPVKAVVSQAFGDDHVLTSVVVEAGTPADFTLFVGPKEYNLLKSFKVNLQENIDFGWFMLGTWGFVRLLAEPMFVLLTVIHGFVGNWGGAIILLTLLIKTVFVPLTHKSYKSMRAMQAVQPQLKAIQSKHKDNKEKLSKETMALYREHGINPLGGCLPIFLQIPFFIAFFNILYTAIELRHAPFVGWIADLSVKDPYYILPVIMGISMFVQQKIQPTTMDPKQARIMLFLPILFTFFFMSFPAGLVIYWLFNNLFTIGQQYITMNFLEKRPKAA